jgi:hypothetical protein
MAAGSRRKGFATRIRRPFLVPTHPTCFQIFQEGDPAREAPKVSEFRPALNEVMQGQAGSQSDHFGTQNMKTFRRHYPDGANWVVCQDIRDAFSKRMSGITVEFLGLDSFREKILRGGLYPKEETKAEPFLTLPLSFELRADYVLNVDSLG